MCAVSVCQSVHQSVSLSVGHAAQLGGGCSVCGAFAAAFAKLLWLFVLNNHLSFYKFWQQSFLFLFYTYISIVINSHFIFHTVSTNSFQHLILNCICPQNKTQMSFVVSMNLVSNNCAFQVTCLFGYAIPMPASCRWRKSSHHRLRGRSNCKACASAWTSLRYWCFCCDQIFEVPCICWKCSCNTDCNDLQVKLPGHIAVWRPLSIVHWSSWWSAKLKSSHGELE